MIRHRVHCDRCQKNFTIYTDYGKWSVNGIYECAYCDGLGDIKARVIDVFDTITEIFLDYDYLKGWYSFD